MIGASLTFGAQDGLSRLLAESYGPVTVIAIRFWFFALFVLAFATTKPVSYTHLRAHETG